MKSSKEDIHFIYHLKDIRKVGATQDLHQRVTIDQGWRPEEYDVVAQVNGLQYASDVEKALQQFYGYTEDLHDYKTIKTMRKSTRSATKVVGGTVVLTQTKDTGNIGVNMGLKSKTELERLLNKGAIFVPMRGDKLHFSPEEAGGLINIVDDSFFDTGDYFFRVKKLRNLREELNAGQWGAEDTIEDHTVVSTRGKGTKSNPNVCKDLSVNNLTSLDFDKVMAMQRNLQEQFPQTSFNNNATLADIATMAQRNWHALTDEYTEFMDAIGGINDGIGNGAWKYWKADNVIAKQLTLEDLSEGDLKELQMEVVDMFHFFMNFALMAGMSGSDLFNMYISKNEENFERQKRGY